MLKENLVIQANDTKILRYKLTTYDDDGVTLVPMDLTGYTVSWGYLDPAGNKVEVTGTISSPLEGKIEIMPTPQSVANTGTFTYGVKLLSPAGERITIATGSLAILKDVLPL